MSRLSEPMPARGTIEGRQGGAPAVVVTDIARRFGHRWALRGVSLRIEAGEAAALIGHNGSGKTTLLRVISTVLKPTRGRGEVFGFDLVRDAPRIRELVAVLGHSPGLYGDLTARENLEFAVRMSGGTPVRSQIDEALDTVGLGREGDELVRTFSAGMQRRLALARIVLRRPRLILLDEPYAAFDAEGIARVNALIATHKASGGAAIIATHDLAKAQDVVDGVWAIARGQLVDADTQTYALPGDGQDAGNSGAARREPQRVIP